MTMFLFAEAIRTVRVESGIDWPASIVLTLIATLALWTLTWSFRKNKQQKGRKP